MGYNIDQFIDTNVDENFICSICGDVLRNPVCGKCEHVFCALCIETWMCQENTETCPIDRQILKMVELKPAPRCFRNMH